MPDINPSIPVVGQPDSTEEPKVVTALSQLIAAVNDVDSDQIADGTITAADLAAVIQEALFAPGDLKITAHDTADTGWLMCDGSLVSRVDYAALFGRIGTAYGAGDGTTTFALPDLRGRVPVGLGTHADVNALGDHDSAALANRTPRHYHSGESLSATIYRTASGSGAGAGVGGGATGPAFTGGLIDVNGNVGMTSGPLDSPAYLTVNYQIKT